MIKQLSDMSHILANLISMISYCNNSDLSKNQWKLSKTSMTAVSRETCGFAMIFISMTAASEATCSSPMNFFFDDVYLDDSPSRQERDVIKFIEKSQFIEEALSKVYRGKRQIKKNENVTISCKTKPYFSKFLVFYPTKLLKIWNPPTNIIY